MPELDWVCCYIADTQGSGMGILEWLHWKILALRGVLGVSFERRKIFNLYMYLYNI